MIDVRTTGRGWDSAAADPAAGAGAACAGVLRDAARGAEGARGAAVRMARGARADGETSRDQCVARSAARWRQRDDTQSLHLEPIGVREHASPPRSVLSRSLDLGLSANQRVRACRDVIIEKHWRGLLPRTIVDHFWSYGALSVQLREALTSMAHSDQGTVSRGGAARHSAQQIHLCARSTPGPLPPRGRAGAFAV